MTRISLKTVVLAAPLVAAAAGACSSTPAETFGASGATSNAGSTATEAGTTSTAAGTSATSGGTSSSTSAGTASADAGTASTTAGTASSGGASGAAGTAATGGTPSGGSAGTSGGSPTAGSPSGGSAGTGGGGANCETLACVAGVKNTYMDALTSAFLMFGCYNKQAQDCITIPSGMQCPNQNGALPFEQQGISIKQSFTVGGVAGKKYLLTIIVNGISEVKYYENGTRAAGNTDPANPDALNGTDTFYTGGDPVNFENYNVYKITTFDGAKKEIQHYYLNSFPKTATEYEHHQTFPLAFTHDISVEGGATVELLQADRNCHAIDNCGAGFRTAECGDAEGRKVPNEPNLVLPTSYVGTPLATMNPHGGTNQPFHSQIIHIVANAVKPM